MINDEPAFEFWRRLDELEKTDPDRAKAIRLRVVETFCQLKETGAFEFSRGDSFEARQLKLKVKKVFGPIDALFRGGSM